MTDTKCIQPTELLHPAQLKLLLIKCYRRNAAELQFTRGPGAWLLSNDRLKSLTWERMIGETSVGYFSRLDAGNDSVIFGEYGATTDTVTICRPSTRQPSSSQQLILPWQIPKSKHYDAHDYLKNISSNIHKERDSIKGVLPCEFSLLDKNF